MAYLSIEEIRKLATDALLESGCDQENADAVADIVTRAERDGSHSHGLFRLPGYIKGVRSGIVNGAARPAIDDRKPGAIRVKGDNGYAPLAQRLALAALKDRARTQGVAIAGLKQIFHFAALWPEVETLAEAGLVGMAMTAALPYVAPAGASEAVFGTNPMGFAWPRDGKPPFVFDQASASMARGDVMIAARDGKSVPLGVGVDASGKDTTDPAAIIDGGVQLAFGGYKGASIALMVELLAGPLIGECLSIEAFEHPSKDIGLPFGGEVIIAIDPDALADGDWRGHGEKLLGKLEGMEGVRIAGERRHRNRAKGGAVEVSDQLLQTIAEARAG